MLVSDFDTFVRKSDQSVGKPYNVRRDIATYGLAAEIGSVISAVKKRLLAEGGCEQWNARNDEIIEELGDVVWYCFSLADIANPGKPVNIFAHDIANLKREIGAGDERADRIRRVLDPAKRAEFLQAAESFPKRTKLMEFEDYQRIAFLTARTEPRTLAEVCLAVLLQLSAELFREKLPPIELELNKSLADRPINDVLGEIAWHLAALASIYEVKLSDIAQNNIKKVSFRLDRSWIINCSDAGRVNMRDPIGCRPSRSSPIASRPRPPIFMHYLWLNYAILPTPSRGRIVTYSSSFGILMGTPSRLDLGPRKHAATMSSPC